MLSTQRLRTIAVIALPIIGGMMSQNVLNLIDIAMVGALGPAALAAVGMAGFLNFMAVGAITGLSAAVQATAARRFGENKHDETAIPLNGGLLIALCAGLPISVLLIMFAPNIFAALIDDPEVVKLGGEYWRWRLVGVVAIGMNFSFRGYWSGVNKTTIYLRTIIVMHVLNVPISYVLIFGKFGAPELGVAGAGIGTTASVIIGCGLYWLQAWRLARPNGFAAGIPPRESFVRMLKLAAPNSLQQFLFAAGFATLFWIIGQVGTNELAVANVLINIMLVAILPGIALGIAAASLAGQALGRREPDDAHRWGWDVSTVAAISFAVVCSPMVLAPDLLLMGFLHTPELRDLGRLPLQLTGLGLVLDGIGLVLMNALLGAGAAGAVMRVAVGMQWLIFLPAAYVLGPVLGYGLLVIWFAMMAWRGLQAVTFIGLWQARKWQAIEV